MQKWKDVKGKWFGRVFGRSAALILVFVVGLCMLCNIFFLHEETIEMEGIVEYTYMSGATHKGRTIAETPMCRVVWYDKEGEKVIYGMPNNKDYEVGDSYFFEVDERTWRRPKKTSGEIILATIVGVAMCMVVIVIWMGTRKKSPEELEKELETKQGKGISVIERRRRETYNQNQYLPVIKCSICNGEQVAGFKDRKTGHFTEIMLIQSEKDLEEFKERYGVEKVVKEY